MAASTQVIMSSIVDNHSDIGCSCTITSNKSARIGFLYPDDWNLSWTPSKKSGIISYSISNNILTFTKTFPLLIMMMYNTISSMPVFRAYIQGISTTMSAISESDDGSKTCNPLIPIPLCTGLGYMMINRQIEVGTTVAKLYFPFV